MAEPTKWEEHKDPASIKKAISQKLSQLLTNFEEAQDELSSLFKALGNGEFDLCECSCEDDVEK